MNTHALALIPQSCRTALLAAGSLLALAAMSAPASAELRMCNSTAGRVGVAVGYNNGDEWVSEGWWNVEANSCEILLEGPLVARFYYFYAIDYEEGGEWSGTSFMCTADKKFTIRDITRCEERGYHRNGFMEVDTGERKSWTVRLTPVRQDQQANGPQSTGG